MIRGIILDMDGVLWRGDQPLGDLPRHFAEISKRGWQVSLATNNSTLSASQYVDKLAHFGVNLSARQIVNSAEAVGQYLHKRFPTGSTIYVVGEHGLREALLRYGFQLSGENPVAVVAGLDRQATYAQLSQATLFIRAGVPFIGTNPDKSFPTPQGLTPGAGAILALLQTASDIEPTIIGKPSPEMYRVALDRMGLTAPETLVVGDRLDTDIVGAQALHCQTALVLSGVSTRIEAQAWQPAPDYIAENLGELLTMV